MAVVAPPEIIADAAPDGGDADAQDRGGCGGAERHDRGIGPGRHRVPATIDDGVDRVLRLVLGLGVDVGERLVALRHLRGLAQDQSAVRTTHDKLAALGGAAIVERRKVAARERLGSVKDRVMGATDSVTSTTAGTAMAAMIPPARSGTADSCSGGSWETDAAAHNTISATRSEPRNRRRSGFRRHPDHDRDGPIGCDLDPVAVEPGLDR